VLLHDLDVNFHVNNVSYVKWALDVVPLETYRSHGLAAVEVSFRAEIQPGDAVRIASVTTPGDTELEIRYQVDSTATGSDAARLLTRWRPRSPGGPCSLHASSRSQRRVHL
jgi:acyl-ACP thioesterase